MYLQIRFNTKNPKIKLFNIPLIIKSDKIRGLNVVRISKQFLKF